MAKVDREGDFKRNINNVKKADILIQTDMEINQKVDRISAELKRLGTRLDIALAQMGTAPVSVESGDGFSLAEELKALQMEMKFIAAQNQNIFTELSKRIAEIQIPAYNQNAYPRMPQDYYVPPRQVTAEIDYDKLAQKIVELMPAQEYVSADYIACKVAEQIVIPENTASAAAQASAPVQEYAPAQPVNYAVPVDLQLDEDDLADRIALKVGTIKPEEFDIIVDDEGCSSISDGIVKNLDYNAISSAVADKLRDALDLIGSQSDYEEMASRISEKITVAGINEDAIADKAAAALSNYLPEIDTDAIADKVAGQVLDGMPEALDSEAICKNISDRLIENQESHDYDIVLDEDGLDKITENVSEVVLKSTDERFNDVDREIKEIKVMLASGALLREAASAADANSYVTEESSLVTVSDIVENEDGNSVFNEDAAALNGVLGVIGEDLDEVPSEGEIMPDGFGAMGGVDFEHMMKYNRSFIARIIQSPDDYKQYYGQVKTALLSYAKVNSNIAWGAERFNKGRETIARFKIRGKTLCLYLALDPNEYKTSVYHHIDVSDNKSMHGTPMMVKIKSPLGARKAIRLIDEMLEKRGAVKRNKVVERDYAAMYPYESIEELIEDGLVKDVGKNK